MLPAFADHEYIRFAWSPLSGSVATAAMGEVVDAPLSSVSVAGVTGAREALPEELGAFLQRVRRQTKLPLGVGFGISLPEHIEALRGKADAAIVGSAIVDVIEHSPRGEVGAKVREYVEVLTGRKKARI